MGFIDRPPLLAGLFLLPALSLGGIPPLSGFWAKFTLIRAGLETEQYAIVTVALAVGLLTLFSMTKIWAEAFWKARPDGNRSSSLAALARPARLTQLGPLVLLAASMVLLGLAAEPVMVLSMRAAEQLLDPTTYVQTVLGAAADDFQVINLR